MIRFSMDIELNKTDELASKFEQARKEALLKAAISWHRVLVSTILVGGRSGRLYRVPGSGATYTASAPNEAPARLTGQLASSYRFQVNDHGGEEVAEVGSPEIKALWLEKGTRNMAPRPHLMPAFEVARQEIYSHLGRRWDQ